MVWKVAISRFSSIGAGESNSQKVSAGLLLPAFLASDREGERAALPRWLFLQNNKKSKVVRISLLLNLAPGSKGRKPAKTTRKGRPHLFSLFAPVVERAKEREGKARERERMEDKSKTG